jgi:hypothetical protein
MSKKKQEIWTSWHRLGMDFFHSFGHAKFSRGDLIYFYNAQLPQKNNIHFKSGQNRLKNNHLFSLV